MSEIVVIQGDCRLLIPGLTRKFDFIFADPPFNTGEQYQDYDDRMDEVDYSIFTAEWIDLCANACSGVMALHGPDNLIPYYLNVPVHHSEMNRIAWIIWHYRFGQYKRTNWIRTHEHCLVYANIDYTWNADAVFVDSDRVAYGDSRILASPDAGKRVPGTVWGVPSDGLYWGRVQGNSAERMADCPNQLPEVYLERLIKAYTNPGDWILDPFGGSGTTAVVAQSLDRNCVTIDIGHKTCEVINARLKKGAVRV